RYPAAPPKRLKRRRSAPHNAQSRSILRRAIGHPLAPLPHSRATHVNLDQGCFAKRAVPLVSFIIPAHNEQGCLAATLEAIHTVARELTLSYEVIVVDDASTDGT